MNVRIATSLLLLWVFTVPAFGGTIRHDRTQQQYLDLAQQPQFASAGRFSITRGAPGFNGSGVLVGDRWVLTAAHLIDGAVDMKFIVGGNEYAAEGWVFQPKYDGDLRKGYDIGLVKLKTPVTNVTPATLNRSKREQNQVAVLAGFGRTGDGINGGQPLGDADFLARAGTNVIDGSVFFKKGVEFYNPRLTGRVMLFDFDNPTNPADNGTGSATPTDLEFLISQGDSGGPTFIADPKTGLPVVAGIHSFGEFRDERDDSDYGDTSGDTRVSAYRAWINSTIKRGDAGREIKNFIVPAGATAMPEPSAALVALFAPLAMLLRRSRRR